MRIVFLCHEAERTGVPILLLRLVKWLRSTHDVRSCVIFLRGGPLEEEFRRHATVFKWSLITKPKNRSIAESIVNLFARGVHRVSRPLRMYWLIKSFNPDVLYLNTVACIPFFARHHKLLNFRRKILHCHEMPFTITRYVPDQLLHLFKRMDRIIAVNSATVEYFRKVGYPTSGILHVTEYLDEQDVRNKNGSAAVSTPFVILGAGLASWRKGIDLFVQTAVNFSKIYKSPFEFRWVGYIDSKLRKQLLYEIEMSNLKGKVILCEEQKDISKFISESHVLLLTSREDPYPLVMLEAAAHAKPTVYFSGAGGAAEFVNDARFAVSPFDTNEMATKLLSIASDAQLRISKGLELQSRVPAHDVRIIGQRIFDDAIQPKSK